MVATFSEVEQALIHILPKPRSAQAIRLIKQTLSVIEEAFSKAGATLRWFSEIRQQDLLRVVFFLKTALDYETQQELLRAIKALPMVEEVRIVREKGDQVLLEVNVGNAVAIADTSTIRLFRGLEQKLNRSYDSSRSDAPIGYTTWTDNLDLARAYAGGKGYVYCVDLPRNQLGTEIVDADGERPLFVDNKKKAGLHGISGKEFLVYIDHDLYDPSQVREYQGPIEEKASLTSMVPFTDPHKAAKDLTQALLKLYPKLAISSISKSVNRNGDKSAYFNVSLSPEYGPHLGEVRLSDHDNSTYFHQFTIFNFVLSYSLQPVAAAVKRAALKAMETLEDALAFNDKYAEGLSKARRGKFHNKDDFRKNVLEEFDVPGVNTWPNSRDWIDLQAGRLSKEEVQKRIRLYKQFL